jgi:hypothetical protein
MESQANPIELETSVDGTTPAGAIDISVKNIGTVIGTLNGVSLKPGDAVNYGFVAKPYRAIAYQTNGSTFKIKYTI